MQRLKLDKPELRSDIGLSLSKDENWIDAVGIVGQDGKVHWAVRATGSSIRKKQR